MIGRRRATDAAGGGPATVGLAGLALVLSACGAAPAPDRGPDEITVAYDGDDGNSITELIAGNVDVLTHVTGAEVPKLQGDPRFRVYHEYNTSFVLTAAWNPRDAFFSDPSVRKALTMAIDRFQLARLLDYPEGPPVSDVIYTADQFHRGELPPALPFDAAAAARLLEAAGWRDGDGDGVRERDGVPFRFRLIAGGRRRW